MEQELKAIMKIMESRLLKQKEILTTAILQESHDCSASAWLQQSVEMQNNTSELKSAVVAFSQNANETVLRMLHELGDQFCKSIESIENVHRPSARVSILRPPNKGECRVTPEQFTSLENESKGTD